MDPNARGCHSGPSAVHFINAQCTGCPGKWVRRRGPHQSRGMGVDGGIGQRMACEIGKSNLCGQTGLRGFGAVVTGGGAGLGWIGSRLAPKAESHGLGPGLRLSGLTAAQTADDPRAKAKEDKNFAWELPQPHGGGAVALRAQGGGDWGMSCPLLSWPARNGSLH